MESKELVVQLRDALTHLYDPAHLQSHPLAIALVDAERLGQMTRSQKLRRVLLDALEQLSPLDAASSSQEDSACYQALHYRYLDGLSVEEISSVLAMSPRQIYRKLREGLEALASLLADQLQQTEQHESMQPAPDRSSNAMTALADSALPREKRDRRALAQAALQQMGSNAHPEAIAINHILATIVRDLRLYCERIGATIQLEAMDKNYYIYADRAMLRQALLNLLTSGLDQVATGVLEIRIVAVGGELQLICNLQAAINGHNQPADAQTSCTKREGVGLEVAIQLFEMQNMQVENHWYPGQWHVTIRMALTGPHHILVIDDMPDIPPLFRRFTTDHAIEVISAGSGEEALGLLQQMTPALILLDIMLPRHDGWEILQTLKNNPATATIPVIICSILNEPGLAHALGADSYLPKPVTQEALLAIVGQWLQPTLQPPLQPALQSTL